MTWRVLVSLVCLTVLATSMPTSATAQQGGEGLFLLLPVGARAVGMGEAVVAQRGGSEQLWWNPAGLTGQSTKELALHHSQTVVGQGNAIAFVLPTRRIGTFGFGINILDLGQQTATDDQIPPNPIGTLSTTDFAYALSYALSPMSWLSLGATVQRVELRNSCTGLCATLPIGGSRSTGFDMGMQVHSPKFPVILGAAVRHLGVGTGDMRPARVDVGGTYRVSFIDRYTSDVEVFTSASTITTTGFDSTSVRLGTDIVFDKQIHVRGGYIVDHASGSGASLGFGFGTARFVFDIARTFGGLSAEGDRPPTYFSLRYLW